MTEELRTGFGSWVARQPDFTEAGKLAAAWRADHEAGGLQEWPRTVTDARSWVAETVERYAWARGLRRVLEAALEAWRAWLYWMAKPADKRPPEFRVVADPVDPFNPKAKVGA